MYALQIGFKKMVVIKMVHQMFLFYSSDKGDTGDKHGSRGIKGMLRFFFI